MIRSTYGFPTLCLLFSFNICVPIISAAQGTGKGCKLPDQPINGKWTLLTHQNVTGSPGEYVNTSTILTFSCNEFYKLKNDEVLLCLDNGWHKELPVCEKLCSPFVHFQTQTVECKDRRGKEISCFEAVNGTVANFECSPYYQLSGGRNRYCVDGLWNLPQPICRPDCGRKFSSVTTLAAISHEKNNVQSFPWMAALYKLRDETFEYICGGTILSEKFIITVAHCVTDDLGNVVKTNLLKIGVGKYFSKYQDPRDDWAQYSEIEKVIVAKNYQGESLRYSFDVALLVTQTRLKFSLAVQPICYDDSSIKPNVTGTVVSWGYRSEDDVPSDILRGRTVTYKERETCLQLLPENFKSYFTMDKFCAVHNNNKTICRGDSGNGFVVRNYNEGKFYLRGLVSLAPRAESSGYGRCDIQLYTNIVEFYDFIEETVHNIN